MALCYCHAALGRKERVHRRRELVRVLEEKAMAGIRVDDEFRFIRLRYTTSTDLITPDAER